MPEPLQHLAVAESTGLRRKDTTKGPPLRILSLGQSPAALRPSEAY